MTAPTDTTISQAVVARLKATLHRENGGACAVVKLYAAELEKLVQGEPVGGFPALWVYPLRSTEKRITVDMLRVTLTVAVYVAVSTKYSEEARLVGKASQTGVLPLLQSIRTRLFGQKLGFDDLVPLSPDQGYQIALEATADEVPVIVYQYPWETSFEVSLTEDDDGYPDVKQIEQSIHKPPEADDPVLQGITELEDE